MDIGVADDALLADLVASRFELGLDEGYRMAARLHQCQGSGQQGAEADKTGVTDQHAYRVRHLFSRQMAGIGAFEDGDTRVIAQLLGQLPVTDIDGIDPGRTAAQQDICKTARRGANVQTDPADRIEAEKIESMGQFETAARYPRVVLAFNRDRRIDGYRMARLVEPPGVGINQPGHYQALRLASALGEAAVHQ